MLYLRQEVEKFCVNLREIADGSTLNVPATIEDSNVLKACEKAINALGYPKNKGEK